ncbi:hypothetical protein G6F16_001697 [Rhizopus arrhizus]|nr:hypothetical protein G6F23_005444 [Rhizopus arrhizus]KAG0766584.1 hypothetical protein G6F24_003489 [Rhizopus arrhizus]KAG0794428.1 hypothetical protein G6F21_002873 [Rhizopus arrhizus]KAG0814441.1 hypothetical protein G6F20_004770 [Rhizopus arrhizus]KAG0877334.1 hypothetical protein G6F16_001697 [Rhizopus arrhizus]
MRSVLILFSLLCALMVVFSLPLGPTSNLENSQPNKITTLANTLADPPAAEEPAAEAPAAEAPTADPPAAEELAVEAPAAEVPAAEEPAAEEPAAEDPPAKGSPEIPLLGGLLKIIADLLGQILGGLA